MDDKSSLADTSNHEIEPSIPDNLLRSSTFDNKPKIKGARRSSGNYQRRFEDLKSKQRRSPVPVRHF